VLGPELRERTLDAVFAEAARAHAARPALIEPEGETTYAALESRVARLAGAIEEHAGVGGGQRVLLLLARPALQVAGIHAVLRAGHAFVPLDASHPAARRAQVAAHAEACAVVTEPALAAAARELAAGLPVLEVEAAADAGPALDAPTAPDAEAMACLLYTSGSTGTPKGVVHTHATLLHSYRNYARSLRLTPEDRLALTGSYGFAATLSDVFGATLTGAALTAWSLRERGVAGLPAFLAASRTSVWFAVPSVFRRVASAMDGSHDLSALRVVKLAGEPARREDFALFERHLPRGAQLLNSLGQTELNLIAQHFLAHGAAPEGDLLPVGRVAEDVEVRIVDPDAEGVGELEIASRWLARGYWRDPEASARAFREEPGGVRAFRSGDRGRIVGGVLEHRGRADAQVKIGGVRIDPGEVEAAICATGRAREALVVARPAADGELRLVAYLVPDPGPEARAALHRELAERLPLAMVPSAFVGLAAWPLNANGKVDRTALPAPERAAAASAPRERAADQLEELVERTLARVLDVKRLGPEQDFFAAGGDSLRAISATLRLEQALGHAVPPSLLLVERSARGVARALREGGLERHWRTLVPLQTRGAEPALFCIHPHAGNVACYALLAGHLAPDVPVYGLQARGLDGRQPPHPDLEALLADYLGAIRGVAARGPYRLAGWCVGGWIALELAQRLRRAGEEVELLVLCDTRLPLRGLRALRENWREEGAAGVARAATRSARAGWGRLRRAFGAPQRGEDRVAARMSALIRTARPSAYGGRVLALDSRDAPKELRLRTRDWLHAEHVECIELAVTHHAVLAEPSVADVAKLVRERLARAAAQRGGSATAANTSPPSSA
jgi:amino acid adenylation domain-containing protein